MIFYEPFDADAFNDWCTDNGDKTLRLNYNLNENSIVVDAGGYVGQWAHDINSMYNSIVFVLEPVSSLYDGIVDRFAQNSRVIPFHYGLSNRTHELQISVNGDSSSTYDQQHSEMETILCKDVVEFFNEQNIDSVDLMKINIEGGEYDLMEHIIKNGLHHKITNFQIQYHRFVPDCADRRNSISEALSKTHSRSWNYEWIWENWELKK